MTEIDLGKYRYLVVDDDEFSRDVLASALSHMGATQVHCAADGAQAIRLASQLRPDFILLDIYMPEIDGWAVLDQLRQLLPGVVAVMVTGSVLPGDFTKSMDQRVEGYCIKPAMQDVLRKTLISAWQRRHA